MSNYHLFKTLATGYITVCLAAFAFLSTGCASSSYSALTSGEKDKLFEMSKGPCYGRCPVFTLTIYEKGLATYRGERNTDRLGLYVKKLDKDQLERLTREFERANLWQYRDVYQGDIPDMQSVSITIYDGSKKKTVSGKEVRPNAVKWLESLMDQIANSEGWELKEPPSEKQTDDIIPNEFIVELEEAVDPEEWVLEFSDYDMLVDRRFSDNGNYWVVYYDDTLIDSDEMLESVRTNESVISAEYNKESYEKLKQEKQKDDKEEKKENTDATTPPKQQDDPTSEKQQDTPQASSSVGEH
ncbi:MAG TPA: DUF6438 domain-containing protein [Saprospiraceae bacterium]|nr:DUF6438 domain-containing protein [Saprospiraceae bacterium]HMQ81324.1 DUF6438 domain-containing protein [Saprospiraceae bacterium]